MTPSRRTRRSTPRPNPRSRPRRPKVSPTNSLPARKPAATRQRRGKRRRRRRGRGSERDGHQPREGAAPGDETEVVRGGDGRADRRRSPRRSLCRGRGRRRAAGICARRAGPERRAATAPPRTPWRPAAAWRRTRGRPCRLDHRRTCSAPGVRGGDRGCRFRRRLRAGAVAGAARAASRPSFQPGGEQSAPQPRRRLCACRRRSRTRGRKGRTSPLHGARKGQLHVQPCAEPRRSCRPAPNSRAPAAAPEEQVLRRRASSRARPDGGRAVSAAANSHLRPTNKKPPGMTGRFSFDDGRKLSRS